MLFDNLTEIFPKKEYSSTRKLEAIERLLIYLTIFCFLITGRIRILIVGIISICFVNVAYKIIYKKKKETFENRKVEKTSPTPVNPFMNVLLTEYTENPLRGHAKKVINQMLNKK